MFQRRHSELNWTATCSYRSGWASCPEVALSRDSCKNNRDARGGWQVPRYLRSGRWGVAPRHHLTMKNVSGYGSDPTPCGWGRRCPQVPNSVPSAPLSIQRPWTSSGAPATWELSFLKTHTALCSIASNWCLAIVLCGGLSVQTIFLIVFSFSAQRRIFCWQYAWNEKMPSFLWVLGSMVLLEVVPVDQWEGIS